MGNSGKETPAYQEHFALLAAELFAAYLARDRREGRVIADFLIGAHAQLHADRLFARERGYLRDYFSRLKLLVPSVRN